MDAQAKTAVNSTTGVAPLSLTDKVLYAAATFTNGAHNAGVNAFLFFYLTAVCGLSGTLAGFLVFLSLMIDAAFDPAVGFWSDNTRSRLGRRHPFMLAGMVPWALAYGFLFGVPTGLDGDLKTVFIAVMLVGIRIANATYMLPYAAMAPEIVRDYHERTSIGSIVTLVNMVGSLTAMGIGFGLFFRGENGLLDRGAYIGFGWTVAGLGLAAMAITYVGTLHLRDRMQQSKSDAPESISGFFSGISEIFRNQSFRVLFMVLMLFWSAEGTAAALNLYIVQYFWEIPMDVIATAPIWLHIGMVIGIFMTTALMRRFSKHGITMVAILIICTMHFLPVPLRLMGLFPEEGLALWVLIYGAVLTTYAALAAAVVSFGAMMADATDEHEYLFGRRREGMYYAAVTLSNKAASGIGTLVAGLILDLVRFPTDQAVLSGGADIPWEPVRNLALIAGPGAALISVTSAFVLFRYRLSEERLKDIQSELLERRGARSDGPAD